MSYYENISRKDKAFKEIETDLTVPCKNIGGRPIPGYSLSKKGEKISDEQIREWLNELVCSNGFPYGYNKLTICLKEYYNLLINGKRFIGFVKS